MEENWKWWKRNLLSKYNRNLFLKKVIENRMEYKREMIEEWNEKDRKHLKKLKGKDEDMGNLRDLYNKL